jgi:hypothetical protein
MEIAKSKTIKPTTGGWLVKSQSSDNYPELMESTFAAIKKKFGETLKSKNRVAQENELLCKFIAYNLTVVIQEMFELGIKAGFDSAKKTA